MKWGGFFRTAVWMGCMLMAAPVLAQQDPKEAPINTERPSFTNSPDALEFHRIQLETGITTSWSAGVRAWDGPEALLRYGFHPSWEVQIGIPNFLSFQDGSGTSSGFGDTTVTVKHQWTKDGAAIDFGTSFYTSAPTGKNGFSSGAWDGGMLFLAQGDLGHNWGLGTMLQVDQSTQDGVKNQQALLSACFSLQVNDRLQPFFEVAAQVQRYGGQEAFFQTGLTYRTDANHQWDIHGAVRLDSNQSFTNVGIGYSVRF